MTLTVRRRIATALDEVARVAGRLADRIDPPRPPEDHVRGRGASSHLCSYCLVAWPCPSADRSESSSRARHPSSGFLSEAMREAVDRDLRTRAQALLDSTRAQWGALQSRRPPRGPSADRLFLDDPLRPETGRAGDRPRPFLVPVEDSEARRPDHYPGRGGW